MAIRFRKLRYRRFFLSFAANGDISAPVTFWCGSVATGKMLSLMLAFVYVFAPQFSCAEQSETRQVDEYDGVHLRATHVRFVRKDVCLKELSQALALSPGGNISLEEVSKLLGEPFRNNEGSLCYIWPDERTGGNRVKRLFEGERSSAILLELNLSAEEPSVIAGVSLHACFIVRESSGKSTKDSYVVLPRKMKRTVCEYSELPVDNIPEAELMPTSLSAGKECTMQPFFNAVIRAEGQIVARGCIIAGKDDARWLAAVEAALKLPLSSTNVGDVRRIFGQNEFCVERFSDGAFRICYGYPEYGYNKAQKKGYIWHFPLLGFCFDSEQRLVSVTVADAFMEHL